MNAVLKVHVKSYFEGAGYLFEGRLRKKIKPVAKFLGKETNQT